MTDAAQIAAGLNQNAKQVIRLLGMEYSPAPRTITRQQTAYAAMKNGTLIEREWQDGCAQCTYYRLTPLGLEVRAILQDNPA